jgi:hypothetical protein
LRTGARRDSAWKEIARACAIAGLAFGGAPNFARACQAPTESARIIAVDARLDMALEDGRIVYLPGLDAPLADEARAALAAAIGPVVLVFLTGAPDRWGRRPVRMKTAGGEDLAERLLRLGHARYRPDALVSACRRALLAAENLAREEKIGLWRAFPPLAAQNRADIAASPPGLSVIEGAIDSFGEFGPKYYVNLGPVRAVDFSFTFARRNEAIIRLLGDKPQDWKGRKLRVRGLIDRRFGLQMEILSADAIEVLDR